MENKNQKPWEPNIEWINKQNFSVDIEDPIYKQILESEEEPEEDAEIVHMLKTSNFVEISDNLEERIMTAYRKEYVYRIAWHNIKTKIMQYKGSLFDGERRLEVVLASIVILFVLSIAYYQYTKPQSTPTDIIANQETPIITVSPNPTITPTISVATPSPVEIVNTNITKNKNNNNTKQDKKNKRSVTKSNSNQNNSKLADRASEEKLATNSTNNKNNISIKEASSDTRSEERSATLIGLRKIYISGFIEIELKDELEKAIKLSGRFMLTSQLEADATLQWSLSQPDTIILSTTTSPIVWKALVDKSRSLQEQAESIIFSLVQTIDIEKEKLEKNEQ